MFLQAVHMNWGSNDKRKDYWTQTKYVLHRDGTLIKTVCYNLSEDVVSTTILHKDTVDRIVDLLNNEKDTELHHDACDGSGWDIVRYDCNGNQVAHYNGYIYGVESFETVVELLDIGFQN